MPPYPAVYGGPGAVNNTPDGVNTSGGTSPGPNSHGPAPPPRAAAAPATATSSSSSSSSSSSNSSSGSGSAPSSGPGARGSAAVSASVATQTRAVLKWLRTHRHFAAHAALERESGVVDVAALPPSLLVPSGGHESAQTESTPGAAGAAAGPGAPVLRPELAHLRSLVLSGRWREADASLRVALTAASGELRDPSETAFLATSAGHINATASGDGAGANMSGIMGPTGGGAHGYPGSTHGQGFQYNHNYSNAGKRFPIIEGVARAWERVFYPLREQQLLEMLHVATEHCVRVYLHSGGLSGQSQSTDNNNNNLTPELLFAAISQATAAATNPSITPDAEATAAAAVTAISARHNAFVDSHGFAPPFSVPVSLFSLASPASASASAASSSSAATSAAAGLWSLSDFTAAVIACLKDLKRLAPTPAAFEALCACLPAAVRAPGTHPADLSTLLAGDCGYAGAYAGWSVPGGRLGAAESVLIALADVLQSAETVAEAKVAAARARALAKQQQKLDTQSHQHSQEQDGQEPSKGSAAGVGGDLSGVYCGGVLEVSLRGKGRKVNGSYSNNNNNNNNNDDEYDDDED